ncbi:uncharacterized protein LOC126323280 [Schistocerca gregaria]|uniref:uncharacterized protein LOC126323280 n=1 Tax=Schistocerca gregaria TaxID=7010 RepID=UPI00211E5E8F|nr:uncharacterized protein LOC126323280 [Schistocerca gregaria]XP_049850623.1 uncharacterized protein LOC126323280 [Schistocerca gregaria]
MKSTFPTSGSSNVFPAQGGNISNTDVSSSKKPTFGFGSLAGTDRSFASTSTPGTTYQQGSMMGTSSSFLGQSPAAPGPTFSQLPTQTSMPGFGAPSSTLSSSTPNSLPQPGQPPNQPPSMMTLNSLQQRIQQISMIINPKSPYCSFRHFFYNCVNPAEIHYYQRPPDFDAYLWDQAMRQNPYPGYMIPHQVSGFKELKQRIEAQDKETEAQLERLAEVESFVASVVQKHSLDTAVRLDELKRESMLLGHRLLTVSTKIEVLKAHGLAIQPDEDLWRQKLHNHYLELQKPNKFHGRLNELALRVRMRQAQEGRTSLQMGTPAESLSTSELNQISAFLAQQQVGLEHLINVLRTHQKNMQTVIEHLDQIKTER